MYRINSSKSKMFVNPDILNFILHWTKRDREIVTARIVTTINCYKNHEGYTFEDCYHHCILTILEEYEKNSKISSFHMKLLIRKTLSDLFGKRKRKSKTISKEDKICFDDNEDFFTDYITNEHHLESIHEEAMTIERIEKVLRIELNDNEYKIFIMFFKECKYKRTIIEECKLSRFKVDNAIEKIEKIASLIIG